MGNEAKDCFLKGINFKDAYHHAFILSQFTGSNLDRLNAEQADGALLESARNDFKRVVESLDYMERTYAEIYGSCDSLEGGDSFRLLSEVQGMVNSLEQRIRQAEIS